MAKTAQSSNTAACPVTCLSQAEFMSPGHAEHLEQFQTFRKIVRGIPTALTSSSGRICEAKTLVSNG